MPLTHTFTYSPAQGSSPPIELDIHLPATNLSHLTSSGKLKTVLWIHGGGLLQGDKSNLAPHWKNAIEKEGFALISVNYRHAPQVRVPDVLADVGKALNWVVEKLPGELKKVVPAGTPEVELGKFVLSGSSAGGWLALLLTLGVCPEVDGLRDDVRSSFIACATIYPITNVGSDFFKGPRKPMIEPRWPDEAYHSFSDPKGPIQSSTPGDFLTEARYGFYPWAQKNGQVQNLLFSPEQQQEGWLEKTNVIQYVSSSRSKTNWPPLYIVHGDKDTAVEVEQSRDLVDALRTNHPEVEVVYEEVPGKEHIWDQFNEEETMPGFWEWIRGKLSAL